MATADEQHVVANREQKHAASNRRLFSPSQREVLLRTVILTLICLVSFSIRMFSVLRFESIIHEFDPWFIFRATRCVSDALTSFTLEAT